MKVSFFTNYLRQSVTSETLLHVFNHKRFKLFVLGDEQLKDPIAATQPTIKIETKNEMCYLVLYISENKYS